MRGKESFPEWGGDPRQVSEGSQKGYQGEKGERDTKKMKRVFDKGLRFDGAEKSLYQKARFLIQNRKSRENNLEEGKKLWRRLREGGGEVSQGERKKKEKIELSEKTKEKEQISSARSPGKLSRSAGRNDRGRSKKLRKKREETRAEGTTLNIERGIAGRFWLFYSNFKNEPFEKGIGIEKD